MDDVRRLVGGWHQGVASHRRFESVGHRRLSRGSWIRARALTVRRLTSAGQDSTRILQTSSLSVVASSQAIDPHWFLSLDDVRAVPDTCWVVLSRGSTWCSGRPNTSAFAQPASWHALLHALEDAPRNWFRAWGRVTRPGSLPGSTAT